ncbi:hypothetical protein LUZ60_010103 [Juncus effusus]|nr:hypothetical protein LUZ60_010103 [Juncus effusus]
MCIHSHSLSPSAHSKPTFSFLFLFTTPSPSLAYFLLRKIKHKRHKQQHHSIMQDPLTEVAPPSRFFDEDLDIFAAPPPSLAAPLPSLAAPLLLPNPRLYDLLIVAISPASSSLLSRLPSKTLIGSLSLPEIPDSGKSSSKSFHLYSVEKHESICLASVRYTVSPERSRAVAKCLLEGVKAEKVLILDSLKSQNYRGRIHVDETLAFKLETVKQRESVEKKIINGIDYLPSGSVMDGLGAAILTECQMRGLKGTLLAHWPENGGFEVFKKVFEDLGFDVGGIEQEMRRANSDLYT